MTMLMWYVKLDFGFSDGLSFSGLISLSLLKYAAISSLSLLLFLSIRTPVYAQVQAAPSRLSEVEKIIVGSSGKASVEQRVKALELKVFGKAKSGSLESRIKSLESFAGIKNSDSMPPLPPHFEKAKTGDDNKIASPKIERAANASQEKDQSSNSLEAAVKLHHDGKILQAEESLRKILEDNPRSADAFFSLGAIAESRGDFKAALDYYTSAMQANPGDIESREAVAEMSRKITASRNDQFVNPLLVPANQPAVLQGRASELSASGNARSQAPFSANAANNALQTPTLGVSQNQRQRSGAGSTIARSLARAALSTALSGTGLHCPMCQLLRGF